MKVFHCIATAQIMSRIYDLSRELIFNLKKNVLKLEAYSFIKNETSTQVFSCKFAKFKNVTVAQVKTVTVIISQKRDCGASVFQ